MKNIKKLTVLISCVALAFWVSCKPVNPDDPDKGKTGPDEDLPTDVINGTTIAEGMNACGLVSDAKTGKGIPGIPVTDGYSYVVTDANGVYQMAANRYTRNIYLSVPAEFKIPLDPAT
ncbi:MAG: hypothetical protein IIU09_00195, partial [Bacteroidales bacterium]|nr:hypothetical protein [Bacteroidales bacterium]